MSEGGLGGNEVFSSGAQLAIRGPHAIAHRDRDVGARAERPALPDGDCPAPSRGTEALSESRW